MRAKADGAVCHRRAQRHAVQLGGGSGIAIEVHHVARLGHRNIDTKDRGIGHAPQPDDRSVQIRDSDYHLSARSDRQADRRARSVRGCFRIVQDLLYVRRAQSAEWPRCRGDQVAFGRLPLAVCWRDQKTSRASDRPRGKSRRERSLIYERQRDSADENHTGSGRCWPETVARPGSRRRRSGERGKFRHIRIVHRSYNADPSEHDIVVKNRDAPGIHGGGARVVRISLTGYHSGTESPVEHK